MRWRALYCDGVYVAEDLRPGGAYATLDRARLVRFELIISVRPVLSVEVPQGTRLVWRKRTTMHPRTSAFRVRHLVALESADRSVVALHIVEPDGTVTHRSGYGPEVWSAAPTLSPAEVCS